MRRFGEPRDAAGRLPPGTGRDAGTPGNEQGGEPLFPSAYMYYFILLVFAAVVYNGLLLAGIARPLGSRRADLLRIGTEEEIYRDALQDLRRYRAEKRPPQHFGLTPGAYAAEMPPSCKRKLLTQCNWNISAQGRPPIELLTPGPLAARTNLSELSLCFLWYSGSFWTRTTGGARGKLLARHGGQVDNKANLASWMRLYEVKFGCQAHQVLPVTVDLRDPRTCDAFFKHNNKLAPSNSSLWFLKDIKGSTGRHIRLLRPPDIQRASLHEDGNQGRPRRLRICNNSVASLGVPRMMTMHGRKFDHRLFILIPSFRPLIVYIHHGHLRFSALNLTCEELDSCRASAPSTSHPSAPSTSHPSAPSTSHPST